MSSILTVSAINTYIAFKLKNDPKLKGIAIKGEISDFSVNYSSGHMYFSLTDGKSSIKAVMFSSSASRLKFYPEVGLSVIAFGGIDVFERGGIYQLNCTQLVPDGAGADSLRLEKLKNELSKAGIFSKPKKPIVKYPKKIAVVTSPTGAAIEDIRSVIKRRFPSVKIIIFPATVQGITAPKSISEAIHTADGCGADTLILTRGGGSNDDLSCFNTKETVMAVYNCVTPVISAVGHEIDYTLCDYAADLRAPTPSAAAELATPDIAAIESEINYLKSSLCRYAAKRITNYENSIASMKQLVRAYSPINTLNRTENEILSDRAVIERLVKSKLLSLEALITGCMNTLSGFDPMKVISRGYALVYSEEGMVTSAKDVDIGGNIKIYLSDGKLSAKVTDSAHGIDGKSLDKDN